MLDYMLILHFRWLCMRSSSTTLTFNRDSTECQSKILCVCVTVCHSLSSNPLLQLYRIVSDDCRDCALPCTIRFPFVCTTKHETHPAYCANKLINLIISLNNEFTHTLSLLWFELVCNIRRLNNAILKRCSFGFIHNCHRCSAQRIVHDLLILYCFLSHSLKSLCVSVCINEALAMW